MARVGKTQVTWTRQLTNLGMEIQQSDVTFGAAPRPPIRPIDNIFQKLMFIMMVKYHHRDGNITVMVMGISQG